VEAAHLLAGLLQEDNEVANLVRDLGADPGEVRDAVTGLLASDNQTPSAFYDARRAIEQRDLGKVATLLDTLGRDLTAAARQGELKPIIGRDRELRELITVLLGMSKNNALLIGEAGVGKTAVVEGLAQRIVAGEAPGLERMRIRTIEVGSLVAGTMYRGQFEQRLKELIDGLRGREDVILFIDEMHMLVGAGETGLNGSVDAANMLKPVLSDGGLKVIGATTFDEYRRHLESDKALMRRFQQVVVGAPSREEALAILHGLRSRYEDFHVARIEDSALVAAVDLTIRHVHDRHLPDKALTLLDRACAEERLVGWPGARRVDADDVSRVLSVMLEIPLGRLVGDERRRLATMADELGRRVVGQEEAVEVVTHAIVRARAGLGNPDRPYGIFFFLGPTGVGKSKLAEELAAFLFGGPEDLLALDMSQYGLPHSAVELIGTGLGSAGWDRGGRLTNAVRQRPYSVVLLDEMEKADRVVWNLFLPVFENGTMTDALGQVIDFRNTVIIMTANVGAGRFAESQVGFGLPDDRRALPDVSADVIRDLSDTFPPELLNRVDEVVVFRPLDRHAIRGIVRRRIEEVGVLDLDLTDAAVEHLVEHSWDPAMGARPVRRAVQRLVANPLSMMMARDEVAEGDTVVVDLADGGLTFTRSG
jgi:ATP-dependent Clp protease ATP-binding subunit ClpC